MSLQKKSFLVDFMFLRVAHWIGLRAVVQLQMAKICVSHLHGLVPAFEVLPIGGSRPKRHRSLQAAFISGTSF